MLGWETEAGTLAPPLSNSHPMIGIYRTGVPFPSRDVCMAGTNYSDYEDFILVFVLYTPFIFAGEEGRCNCPRLMDMENKTQMK